MIRLYVLIGGPQWSLTLVTFPRIPSPSEANTILVNVYREKNDAKDAMGELGLLLMKKTAASPTLDIRDIVISAVDEFKRSHAA